MSFNDIFKKLAAAEDTFMQTQFLSPVLRNRPIRVKIDNIVMQMDIIKPKNFEGWGIFQPLSMKEAKRVREPNMAERREYMKMFPAVRVIVCSRKDDQWFGLPSNDSNERFKLSGLVPISLPEEMQMFETVRTRFDGVNFWHDGSDRSISPKHAVFLREEISKLTDVANIQLPGLSAKEKQAYAIALIKEMEDHKDRHEERLRHAVEAAGAEFKSYVERGNTYTVEYIVDGERHRSTVDKETLEVHSAGICLSGQDKKFDLRSLVGVVREGIDRRAINRMDGNYDYDYDNDYGDE